MDKGAVGPKLAHVHNPHHALPEFIDDRQIILDARLATKDQISDQGLAGMFCNKVANRLFSVHNVATFCAGVQEVHTGLNLLRNLLSHRNARAKLVPFRIVRILGGGFGARP